jgi:eukaryotic-like serine/threonine-protein kinase
VSTSSPALDSGDFMRAGSIFAGKYRVEKVLGRGGMGVVLAARHLGLDEPVAIKVLLPGMMRVAGMVERFTREARASAKIKNDHVVRVTDVDALPSGVPYMVMERLDGVDLADHFKRTGPLPVADAVRYLLEASSAIGEAHAMGIVHRDLKPANLFLARRRDETTTIKVLDFGISKVMEVRGEHAMTAAGTLLGSPSYMSPEQISSARDIDGRADLWALGVILYQLLTGTLPFAGESLNHLCALVLQSQPRRPSESRADLPPGLEAVILRCLEKERDRRFSTAGELAAALLPFADPTAPQPGAASSLQSTTPPPLPPATPNPSVPPMSKSASLVSAMTTHGARARSSGRIGVLAGALGLLGLASVGILWLRSSPRPKLAPAAGTAMTETAAAAAPSSPESAGIAAPTALAAPTELAAPTASATSTSEVPRIAPSVTPTDQVPSSHSKAAQPPKSPSPASPATASSSAKKPQKKIDPSEIQ